MRGYYCPLVPVIRLLGGTRPEYMTRQSLETLLLKRETVVTPVKNEIPAEEDIAPAVEAYEEEKLVPLPTAQEEQTPGAAAPEEKSPAVSSSNEDAEELSLTRPSLLD